MPEVHFFYKFQLFFFQKLCFYIEKVYSKLHIDILEKTLIRTWRRDPPINEKPGSGAGRPFLCRNAILV